MNIPEGFFVIYQPKYTVPCVFDLNERGTFPKYPSVSTNWGFRLLANDDLQSFIQAVRLVHQPGKDSQSGKDYNWTVEDVRLDLDERLTPDQQAVDEKIKDSEIRSALMDAFGEWRENFIPVKEGNIDVAELKQKLTNLVQECKERRRKNLVQKNQDWVYSGVPRRIHDFKYGLYNHIKDTLYQEYRNKGGEDTEPNLIKKITLFNQVLENCTKEDLPKPNGDRWKSEDEIWQCWVGFAGSENEAFRVCQTMNAVFRDLQL